MRKNPQRSVFVALLLLPAAAVWCATFQESSAQSGPANIAATAPGRIEGAGAVMLIGTAATGTVAQLLVHAGERVEAGQVLVRVECANLQKELDARISDLAAAAAVLTRVEKGPRPEEIAIGVAHVGLAEARAEEASVALGRLSLSEGNIVTEAQVDQSKRDARIAAAQLDEARAKLAWLRAGSREDDILEAQSRRNAAKALVEEVKARLGYCSARAPSAGVILSVHVTPGQFVSAAVPVTLLKLVDDSRRRVRAEVDERDLGKICMKQRATVTTESFPAAQIEAVTEHISGGMSRRTISSGDLPERHDRDVREVTLSLPDDKQHWPIGLRVSVKLLGCPANAGGE